MMRQARRLLSVLLQLFAAECVNREVKPKIIFFKKQIYKKKR